MTDPTIPADRKDVHDALVATFPVIYDEEPQGLQTASDSLNDAAHSYDLRAFLRYADMVLGTMQTYLSLSQYVDEDHGDLSHTNALRPLVEDLEKALDAAHLNLSKQAHPAGKKI